MGPFLLVSGSAPAQLVADAPGAARHARTAATAYRSRPMSMRPSSGVRDAGWDHGDGWSR